MRLPIQVEGILFRKINGEVQYLLLKRNPEREGFWQPVTGGLEEGETRVEALEREVLEETGIENPVRIVKNVHHFARALLEWKENKEALRKLNEILLA